MTQSIALLAPYGTMAACMVVEVENELMRPRSYAQAHGTPAVLVDLMPTADSPPPPTPSLGVTASCTNLRFSTWPCTCDCWLLFSRQAHERGKWANGNRLRYSRRYPNTCRFGIGIHTITWQVHDVPFIT